MDILGRLLGTGDLRAGVPSPVGKTCSLCAVEYPATTEHFHRHAPSPDGLKPRCKSCQCGAQNAKYLVKTDSERAQIKARVKSWRHRNAGRVALISSRWVEANRAKRGAHSAVQSALRRGILVRKPCEVCLSSHTHAHHEDYAKPLVVNWLCAKHHAEADRRRRARTAA